MKVGDVVSFRKDLLFNGAVQIGWFEHDRIRADKAAKHYIFHGPDYHGVSQTDYESSYKLVDTASFTWDIVQQISGNTADEPFVLAIAGYGTGKSHLGVTLASLLSSSTSKVARSVIKNITMADAVIGRQIEDTINLINQPYLVVTINGMQDFDLSNEIIRQVLLVLNKEGLDTTVLEDLRPRFKTALLFTESFFESLRNDYEERFGNGCSLDDIIEGLKCQDEEIFKNVSSIYEQKMGSPIYAVGQESLHDFIRVTKEAFCGQGKPYAGLVIIFDEFGRYLEFSVRKPYVAGSGALQQLYECVQANGDGVFLLCFVQYELNAYRSRIAPELEPELIRYVTRYNAVKNIRLSTNLETLIANLLEKKDRGALQHSLESMPDSPEFIQRSMQRWFPDIQNHALWMDEERFNKIIVEGCWPLHPMSTWMLYKLASAGKSLQERSALSLLAEVYSDFEKQEFGPGKTLVPVDLCNQALLSEFLASERYGQQGAMANAYETVMNKYQYELSGDEERVLKAVLLSTKIGIKVESKHDYLDAIAMCSGLNDKATVRATNSLEAEYGVLEWNGFLQQYEIAGDSVPRRTFLAYLQEKVTQVDFQRRADIFSQHYGKWTGRESFNTDFGSIKQITTQDWHYKIYFSNVALLKGQINYALKTWHDAREADKEKGQLIYCYVGPESNLAVIRETIKNTIKSAMHKIGIEEQAGAPLAVLLLHDTEGVLGEKLAEYWVLQEQLNDEDAQNYANFIMDRRNVVEQEMLNQFSELERSRNIVMATLKQITESRLKNMLTELFNVVYDRLIPFPFDGFHTARGNAARDCQAFTRELFLGNLDRDWIAACNAQQKNRAYTVLDEAWGVFDNDGSVRLKPTNAGVRKIIELLEGLLEDADEDGDNRPMNLGAAVRKLCNPPYGCNIASAGLLLALFIGRRKDNINLLKDHKVVGLENWLSEALRKGNFLNLSVLDVTDAVLVSEESLSEWDKLLEDWGTEKTWLGKVSFLKKAKDLEEQIPVPQTVYYKYAHLSNDAQTAQQTLHQYDRRINAALKKINRGLNEEDAGNLSWGASELADVLNMAEAQKEQWTNEQIEELKQHLARAKLHTQQLFSKWLPRQTTRNIENLGGFNSFMRNVRKNLVTLGFAEEQKLLDVHVEEVNRNVRLIEELRQTTADIDKMLRTNKVTDSTPISSLNVWLEQVQGFAERLQEARQRTDIVQDDVRDAIKKLVAFQQACKEQLVRNRERTEKVFCIEELTSPGQIANWRHEVGSLITIYEGEEKDVEDLKLVQKQLDLVDTHYLRLEDFQLTDDEFEGTLKDCLEETEEYFVDDAPPLDALLIYESIRTKIWGKRQDMAAIWMEQNVPSIKEIRNHDANKVVMVREGLRKRPRVLSSEQVAEVNKVIKACEQRLDELEVEGLLAQFQAMTDENKKSFIQKIYSYVKSYTDIGGRDVLA
jgi:hypothetical protein